MEFDKRIISILMCVTCLTIILDMVTLKPEYSNLWSIQCNEGGLS